jgi:VIT1/CCC1 family predicted Fe2+/Mn2+ transporter
VSELVKDSLKSGISFGLTSGAITTLGLMVGLESETNSKWIVIGGILTIAVADAFSDALGIHLSEESKNGSVGRQVWESTVATFFTKFLFAMSFLVPVFFLPLGEAVLISVLWGLLVLSLLSIKIAKTKNENPLQVVIEHVGVALLVITITHYLGKWISTLS